MVQRLLQPSPKYKPTGAGATALKALDDKVAGAEADALKYLNNPPSGKHSAHQATFLLRPRPMHWGYCVEEQLDTTAHALGWASQHKLAGSRPDYHQQVGGAEVFADLTTAAQSNPGGSHVTGKLRTAEFAGADPSTWQAADLVHTGVFPGQAARPALRANGRVTERHREAYEAYADQWEGQSNYGPAMDRVTRTYGKVTSAKFTQSWGAGQRTSFARAVKRALDSDAAAAQQQGPPRTSHGRRAHQRPTPRYTPY